jgi:hypothetical protein
VNTAKGRGNTACHRREKEGGKYVNISKTFFYHIINTALYSLQIPFYMHSKCTPTCCDPFLVLQDLV